MFMCVRMLVGNNVAKLHGVYCGEAQHQDMHELVLASTLKTYYDKDGSRTIMLWHTSSRIKHDCVCCGCNLSQLS